MYQDNLIVLNFEISETLFITVAQVKLGGVLMSPLMIKKMATILPRPVVQVK